MLADFAHLCARLKLQRQPKQKNRLMQNGIKDQELMRYTEKGFKLDYLCEGSPIFQLKNNYTFSSDSIALANFARPQIKDTDIVVDFASGSGIVGLEMIEQVSPQKLIMVEMQPELSEGARLSTKFHKKAGVVKIEAVNETVQDYARHNKGSASVVLCNPPYFKLGAGDISKNEKIALARHEIKLTLAELIFAAKEVLTSDGKFFMVHIKSRENEILRECAKCGFKVVRKQYLSGGLEREMFEFCKYSAN